MTGAGLRVGRGGPRVDDKDEWTRMQRWFDPDQPDEYARWLWVGLASFFLTGAAAYGFVKLMVWSRGVIG